MEYVQFTVSVGLVTFKRQIDLVESGDGGRSSSHSLCLQSTISTDKKLSYRGETARHVFPGCYLLNTAAVVQLYTVD